MDEISLFLKLNNKLYDLRTPIVMGIVNATPDSFFSKSRLKSDRSVLQLVERHLIEGATIIDIGGYSTRPQADPVGVDEEKRRVGETLEIIRKRFPQVPVSVDTFRSPVARMAVEQFEASMINDISGGNLDPLMFETVASLGAAYVLMHSRGNPQTMQQQTDYEDIISELLQNLEKKTAQLHLLGVNDVLIDPGFGFAKTLEQNYSILKHLNYFRQVNVPLLVGVSRKSMIYKLLGTTPEKALNGTTAVHMLALTGGASVLRVHDVREAVDAIKVFEAYKQAI